MEKREVVCWKLGDPTSVLVLMLGGHTHNHMSVTGSLFEREKGFVATYQEYESATSEGIKDAVTHQWQGSPESGCSLVGRRLVLQPRP